MFNLHLFKSGVLQIILFNLHFLKSGVLQIFLPNCTFQNMEYSRYFFPVQYLKIWITPDISFLTWFFKVWSKLDVLLSIGLLTVHSSIYDHVFLLLFQVTIKLQLGTVAWLKFSHYKFVHIFLTTSVFIAFWWVTWICFRLVYGVMQIFSLFNTASFDFKKRYRVSKKILKNVKSLDNISIFIENWQFPNFLCSIAQLNLKQYN